MFKPETKAAPENKDDKVVELQVQESFTVKTHTSNSLKARSDQGKRSRDEIFVQQEVKAKNMVIRRSPSHPKPKPPSKKKSQKQATMNSVTVASDSPLVDTPEKQDKVDPVRLMRSPIAEQTAIEDADPPYFSFFVVGLGKIVSNFFPDFVTNLLARSTFNTGVRLSILSMSAMLLDVSRNRPLVRYHENRRRAIAVLQGSLSARFVDEGTAIAVYLLVWMDYVSGCYGDAAINHLRGLSMIFTHLQKGGRKLSPLLMLIWKKAIRMDFYVAHFSGRVPGFPPIPLEDIYEQPEWIQASSNDDSTAAEWAVASFAIDALRHRACHLSIVAEHDRRLNGSLSPLTILELMDLQIAHEKWLRLPIVVLSESIEQQTRLTPPPPETRRFLYYDPIHIHNRQYSNLLNHWKSIKLYLSYIQHPALGPGPISEHRIPTAIEVCRTYAAFGIGESDLDSYLSSWDAYTLIFPAIAFGGRENYPIEGMWAYDRIRDSPAARLPGIRRQYEELWAFCNSSGDYLNGIKASFTGA